jgi:hypothetical protein
LVRTGFSQQIGTQGDSAQAQSKGHGTGDRREHRSRLLVFEGKYPFAEDEGEGADLAINEIIIILA